MRKILIVLYTLGVGGVEKVCYEIASHIDKTKYKCDFLVATNPQINQYYEPLLEKLGCRVFKGGEIVDKSSKKIFLEHEIALIQNERYDVVHSNMDFMNVWTLKCAKNLHVPIRISHVHTMLKNQGKSYSITLRLKHLLYKKMLCVYANRRVGCSASVVKEYYGNASSDIILNGFDTSRFASLDKEADGVKRLINIGRLSNAKNPEFILAVMKALVTIDKSYELLWVGGGEKQEAIDKLICEYGLSNNVVMIGETTDITPYLRQCHIALFPSKFEGLGIAIVEAQLSKCLTYYSEFVPKEAEIGFGVRLSLNIGAKQWAQKIHDDVQKDIRAERFLNLDCVELYDIKQMVKRIERIYG